MHSIVLPYVTAFHAAAAPEAVARVARALGRDDAAAGLAELRASLGIPASLRELGMREEQLDRAADLAAAVAPTVPRQATRDELHALLSLAFAGAPATTFA